MGFCSNCGSELLPDSQFCDNCGQKVAYKQSTNNYNSHRPYSGTQYGYNLVSQLSSRVNTNATIWLVIGVLQVLIGGFGFLFTNIFLALTLIVGIINLVFASQEFKYANEVVQHPVGIVEKFNPLGSLIGSLIYNVLFGGVIGIAGTIYGFVVRNFVITNVIGFQQIENEFMAKN